jgi:lia operon protein LiaF
MRNRTLVFIGVGIIIIGLMSLLDAAFDINLGRFVCPVFLILLGVWFLIRPRLLGPDIAFNAKLLGDVRRRGEWQLADEEIWCMVGDVRLDLTEAAIPSGETTIRILGIMGDVRLTVPQNVGVSVECTSIVTEARILGHRHSRAFMPYHFASDGYDTAERRLRLEVGRIVADVRIKQANSKTAETAA